MSKPGTGAVVVGVDGSASALVAARWAAARAQSIRRPLRLVLATAWPLIERPLPPGVPNTYREQLSQLFRSHLQIAADEAKAIAPDVTVDQEVMTGDPAAVLLAESAEAQEVVVGSRGLGGFVGALVGSVASALAQHANCPVVVVRAEGQPNGPVVIGVDAVASDGAMEYAFDYASRTGAPVLAAHTWSDVDAGLLLAPPASLVVDWESIERDMRELLDKRLAPWVAKYPDVQVERRVARDRPTRYLLELGRLARLLVVGSRGRGGFTGLLLGSTSRALLHHAPCPLAIIRA